MIKFLILILAISTLQANPPFCAAMYTAWAHQILQTLTQQEKIGQLFVVAAASNFEQPTEALASAMQRSPYQMDQDHVKILIQHYHVGGVIFLYKSTPQAQVALTKECQKLAKIPLLIAQDSEWGLSMRLDLDPTQVVRYPRNMTLGAIQDDHLIYQMGYEVGMQCRSIGVHVNCAPDADVNNNPANPVIHDRSFGDNPLKVAHYAQIFAQGLQDAGIIACAKHFPGHGDTHVDSHIDLPTIMHDIARLIAIELYPFKQLIDWGIGAVMTGHLCVPALDQTANLPASMSYKIVTQELKKRFGFNGLVITDGLGMDAITKQYEPGQLELQALLAGNDILLCPLDVPGAAKRIEQAISEGLISQNDLDERVLKILKAKKWCLDHQRNMTNGMDFLVRPQAYELQRKLYRNAITIAKQSDGIPYSPELLRDSLIIQVGTLPDNKFAHECEQYNGQLIQVTCTMSDQELQACLQKTGDRDTVILAIGQMHKFIAQQFGIANNALSLITQLKKLHKQVVVIAFGTPYSLPLFKEADTIMVAYEDAAAAQEAVVDILRGALEAMGKLPVQVLG